MNSDEITLTAKLEERESFSTRLKQGMQAIGCKNSPTVLANMFNAAFQGRAITPHTARNWILGNSLPTQEKMVSLANLLRTSPEQLRFGRSSEKTLVIEGLEQTAEDQQFYKAYLQLNKTQQLLMRDLVSEMKISSQTLFDAAIQTSQNG